MGHVRAGGQDSDASGSAKTRWLFLFCFSQLFIMLVFLNYSAIIPFVKKEWGMNNAMAGSIFSAYQLGYILSSVILSTLTDRFDTKRIFILSALWSGTANLLFALFAHDYLTAMIFRGLGGVGMGGTYMPGLKVVAERFDSFERGKAVGIYVGALVLGAALSMAVTGNLSSLLGWRWACVACSVGVYIGVLLAIPVFRDYVPPVRSKQGEAAPARLVKNRPAILLILGYWGHMWEMYGMRNWLVPFFAVSFLHWGMGQSAAAAWAANAAALAIAMGGLSTAITGTLSDRLGRTRTVMLVMMSSAALSFGLGWLSGVHPWIVLAAGLAYGYLVAAESPVFSTGLTEVVPPSHLGQAMGIQSMVGYSAAMISPTVFGWSLDVFKGWEPFPGVAGDWVVAFSILGAGALAGPICMALLRRSPESMQMAGGRR